MPMPETLDPRALGDVLAMAGGDREFVAAVVEEYLTDSSSTVAALRTATGAELERAAHTLKSTSSSVGAAQLAAICLRIERAAKAGPVDDRLIAAAEAEHASARAALEHHLEAL
jgi:HPt (histidine-containing phosphotransfer) domain-containing protein